MLEKMEPFFSRVNTSNWRMVLLTLSQSHSHSHTLAHSHTPTLTHSHTHTLTLTLTLTHSHAHTRWSPSSRASTPRIGAWYYQLLSRNVKRFRGGFVSKAHRRVYHSTPGSRVIKKREDYRPSHTSQIDCFCFQIPGRKQTKSVSFIQGIFRAKLNRLVLS